MHPTSGRPCAPTSSATAGKPARAPSARPICANPASASPSICARQPITAAANAPSPSSPISYNRVLYHHYRFRYGFDISPTARIGPGLYLGHFGGVVVSPRAVLGANVNIAHGVTIGAASRGPRTGAPTLEDRVWVGAHAILVGNITVGHDALIAPGAYVNFDVPPMAVVLGNPGKVVSSEGSIGYVNRTLDPA